jgi:hypothetical protein
VGGVGCVLYRLLNNFLDILFSYSNIAGTIGPEGTPSQIFWNLVEYGA